MEEHRDVAGRSVLGPSDERSAAALEGIERSLAAIMAHITTPREPAPPTIGPTSVQRGGNRVMSCVYPLPEDVGGSLVYMSDKPGKFRLSWRFADGEMVELFDIT